MKFLFADSLDFVDPRYDFMRDRSPSDRELYWDDQYPHEILDAAPYDGILVSRAIVGDHRIKGRYTDSQTMRFRRVGAREFLRYREKDYPGSVVFGDCGAFTYHKMEEPPFTPKNMVDFYGDGQFTHGCSIDHIIFDFHESFDNAAEKLYVECDDEEALENRRRSEITLTLAADFFRESQRLSNFTPIGVIQGWSPLSMAKAARELVTMGYQYLALGGMVPLRAPQIHRALTAIREEIGVDIRLHLLGFAKADQIAEFARYNISSFDTTSPLLRAFKDARNNYYLPKAEGGLEYFSAIRIPQATENLQLNRLVKAGRMAQEELVELERQALDAVRGFVRDNGRLDEAVCAIEAYSAPLLFGKRLAEAHGAKDIAKLSQIRERAETTLKARVWERCECAICRDVGVEVVIFRASNRNKRRGFHNLWVYGQHVKRIKDGWVNEPNFELSGITCAAE
jgi:hypothetical protein